MTTPQPNPGILDITLYKGGDTALPGVGKIYKLSSNENPHGPSQAAIEAYRAVGNELYLYPSADHAALRTAIADIHGLEADRIICGDGSDEVITWICQAYSGPGDEVLYTRHGFSMYPICARAAGATPVAAPETNRKVDIDAVLAAVTDKTRILFITNPGNPTGTMLDGAELTRLVDLLPARILLVLDGAYTEYTEGFDGGVGIAGARDNVLALRTFSKIYGLGGLRVGWGYGAAGIIDVLNRMRGPFNVNAGGLAAAEAAMRDQSWMAHCRSENSKWRNWLRDELADLGVASDESFTNFILARFASEDEANAADAALRAAGIIVRKVANYGLPDGLRITVGTEEANRLLIRTLKQFFKTGAA